MYIKTLCISFATVSLAACGGSSTSSTTSSSGASFEQLADQGTILAERYQDAELTPTMPTSGTASYSGVAAYSDVPDSNYIYNNAEVVSNVALNANFADNTISGQLSNFQSFENEVITGSVAVNNGQISNNVFTAELSGSLNASGEDLTVAGDMEGAFLGDNADAVGGAMSFGLTDAVGTEQIFGIFLAERN